MGVIARYVLTLPLLLPLLPLAGPLPSLKWSLPLLFSCPSSLLYLNLFLVHFLLFYMRVNLNIQSMLHERILAVFVLLNLDYFA